MSEACRSGRKEQVSIVSLVGSFSQSQELEGHAVLGSGLEAGA